MIRMAKKALKKAKKKTSFQDKLSDLEIQLLDRGEGYLKNKYPHQSLQELWSSNMPLLARKLLDRYVQGRSDYMTGTKPVAPMPRMNHPYNGGIGKPPIIQHYNGPRRSSSGRSVSI